ncbi:MAG TPA: hypothetical protein VHI14_07670 [Jatrophihabitantaceae bacterium]|nr:hypothetical protein [Jatrophihabitantaceae bacterium]
MTSENDLRRILAEEAEQAPEGAPLAERALASLETDVAPRHRAHRWVIPAATAASLVLAASAAAVGINTVTHKPTAGPTPTPSSVSSVTAPTTPPTHSRTQAQSSTSSPPPSTASVIPEFSAASISFDAAGDGFAIASRGCGALLCPGYLLRQAVGAQEWTRTRSLTMPIGVDAASCIGRCVNEVRFATAKVGYVYGPNVLFTTIDAGRTWMRDSGSVADLEASASAVVRVSTSACLPDCTYTVSAAKVGISRWQDATLPDGPLTGRSVYLSVATDQTFFLSVDTADAANSRLFQSLDGGVTWTLLRRGLCAASDEGELTDIAANAAGTVVDYVCSSTSSHHGYKLTVADTAEPVDLGSVPAVAGVGSRIAIGPTGTSLLSAGMLYVNSSNSHEWKTVRVPRANGAATYLGYPVGRGAADQAPAMYLGPDGTALWTSIDDGKTWSSAGFG